MVIDADTLPKPKRRNQKNKTTKKATKRTTRQKALPGVEDEFKVPKKLQNAADNYNESMLEKSRATEDFNSIKIALIETMQELNISRVRVLCEGGNERILRLDEKLSVKCEKPKKDEDE